jgi:hypothetical protein
VRRDELYGDSSDDGEAATADGEDAAALRAKLSAHVSRLISLDFLEQGFAAAGEDVDSSAPADGQGRPEGEFEFRLFASQGSAPKVILAPEGGPNTDGPGGFVVPHRPLSHYLAGEPNAEEKARFRSAAVSGEDVLARSKQRSWGLEIPWRVVKAVLTSKQLRALGESGLEVSAAAEDVADVAATVSSQTKKKRPGKKRRTATRVTTQAAKKKEEAERQRSISKEEHLKEKKKRLNREKKLKRRQKERDKKEAAKAGTIELGTADDDRAPPVGQGDSDDRQNSEIG